MPFFPHSYLPSFVLSLKRTVLAKIQGTTYFILAHFKNLKIDGPVLFSIKFYDYYSDGKM